MEVDNPASGENYLPRVNAGMLGNYIDKNVLIVAEFLSINNLQMRVRCCDGPNAVILAHLRESVPVLIESGVTVQIEAKVKTRNTVDIIDFIVLQNSFKDFDSNLYNETIKLLAENFNDNSYLISNVVDHWGTEVEKEVELVDGSEQQQANANKANGNYESQGASAKDENSFF